MATSEAINVANGEALGVNDASVSFDFRARELYSGSMIEGTDLFGQGSVLVTFIQPDCELSLDGSPALSEIADLHPEATYVIVHSGGDADRYLEFVEDAKLFAENMVHLSDDAGLLAHRYGVNEYPTTLLIDSDLRITSIVGVLDIEAQLHAVQTVVRPATEV